MLTTPVRTSVALAFLASTQLAGCCFSAFADGFQQGFSTEMECQPLIDTVNQASGAVIAVPETPEGGSQAQFDAEYTALATAYESGANLLAGVALTQPALVAPRDELVALYREGAGGMRAMPGLMASATASGDPSALNAHVQQFSDFDAREEQIVARINAACNRQ
ncbi:MAG: hypothetical protein K1X94_21065 [Sandaracinaceae bacterium]|nr:hypothetical protein [Sandaracinaceae bacterium]